jgi:hypothetical protein
VSASLAEQIRATGVIAVKEHILPLIAHRRSDLLDRFCITINSSVAFGLADAHSDLDMFLSFYEHEDYVAHAAVLDGLLKAELRLPPELHAVCDKGIRVELESFRRSDVEQLVAQPQDRDANMRQTDWLLHWFLNAVTVYDPRRKRQAFEERFAFYTAEATLFKRRCGR